MLRFLAQRDNAQKIVETQAVNDKAKERLDQKGAFRPPVRSSAFQRSFNQQFGALDKVRGEPRAGMVTGDRDGRRYHIKAVLPVSGDTSDVQQLSSTQQDQRRREDTQQISDALKQHIRTGEEKALTSVGTFLRRFFPEGEYDKMLRRAGRQLARVIELHRDFELKVSKRGNRQNLFVRRLR